MHSNYKKANAAPRCQYIRLNDQPCTQPALQDNIFCRFHDVLDRPLPDSRQIPFVEDAATLQLALMQVIRSLQLGQVDRRTAGTILYALQIAASNLKHFSEEVGHPFAQPQTSRQQSQEKRDDDDIPGPSLAEILIDRLQLMKDDPRRAAYANDAVPSANNHVIRPPDPPPPASAPSTSDPSGTIDKLEACAAHVCRRSATHGRSVHCGNQAKRPLVRSGLRGNSKLRLIDDFLRLGQELVALDDGGDAYASARNLGLDPHHFAFAMDADAFGQGDLRR